MKLHLLLFILLVCLLGSECALKESQLSDQAMDAQVRLAVKKGLVLTKFEEQEPMMAYLRALEYLEPLAVAGTHSLTRHVRKSLASSVAAGKGVVPGPVPKLVPKLGPSPLPQPVLKKRAPLTPVLKKTRRPIGFLGFVQETVNLLLTLVPLRLSMWAVLEVFPLLELGHEHPNVQHVLGHATLKGLFAHESMQKVWYFANSNFAMITFAFVSMVMVPFFGWTTSMVRKIRRTLFALSYGFLFAALCDLFFDWIAEYMSDAALAYLALCDKAVELAVFCVAAWLSLRFSFGMHVFFAVLGSLLVFVKKHFVTEGKIDIHRTDSFYESRMGQDVRKVQNAVGSGLQHLLTSPSVELPISDSAIPNSTPVNRNENPTPEHVTLAHEVGEAPKEEGEAPKEEGEAHKEEGEAHKEGEAIEA